MIKLALDLYGMATLGCSKVSAVLKVIFGEIAERTPHHTTVRNWIIRNGCYNLEKSVEQSNDLVGIGDITVSSGKLKCLAILGVRMNKLKQRANYTLTHRDVEILDLHLSEKSTGEFVHNSFESTLNRIGSNFLGIVIDQGSDIKKGVNLFQKEHPNTLVIHDIPHKMSLVMKHALQGDVNWNGFIKKLLETRRLIQQTELAAMAPPTQRKKSRFMDIGYLLDWPERVLECRRSGRMNIISEERYQKYFGWLKEFEIPLKDWRFMQGALDMIKSICRAHGLSHDTYDYLRIRFKEMACLVKDEKLRKFLIDALKAVEVESCKLKEGQVMVCSTEVLESIFGKYKELNPSSQGISANVLGLATFVGSKLTEETVKQAMEKCSTKAGIDWIKRKVVNTLGRLRHRFFHGIKGTKFDKCFTIRTAA